MADLPQDAPTTGLTHPPLTAGLGAAPASLAAGVASLGLPAAGQTHPMGPGRSMADAEAPYIVGLRPLRDVSSPALRRGSPPGFPALAAPPGTDSTLGDTLATIQAAVMASRERERAASLALERERALGAALTTQMVTTQRLLGRPPVAPVDHPEDPRDSDLDADLIAALHAQAAGLHNIRALVSVVLDPASSHYPRWRGQVLLTLRRFVLDDHVLVDHDAPPPRSWCLMDSVVLSWLHGTITVELQDIIRDQADTARQAWLALEDQFLGNRDARALHLDAQFHLFSQGDLSVGEYCRQMKGLADSLRDLGEPVADRTLVLNLLRGLSPRYGHLKALIKRSVPFPTFHAVRNELLLEELTMANEAPTPASALYSAPTSGQPPSGGQATRPPSTGAPTRPPPAVPAAPRPTSTTDGGRRSRKGGRGGGGSSRGGPSGRGGGHAWPSFYNPWTGTIAMWPGQAPSTPRPPAPALLTTPHYGAPPYGVPVVPQAPPALLPPGTHTSTPWSPPAGGWDNASLAAAFSTMAMTPPPSDWVIDSGASYHTTPTAGTLSRSHPPSPLTHPRSSLETVPLCQSPQ